jgi:hypothetical protein
LVQSRLALLKWTHFTRSKTCGQAVSLQERRKSSHDGAIYYRRVSSEKPVAKLLQLPATLALVCGISLAAQNDAQCSNAHKEAGWIRPAELFCHRLNICGRVERAAPQLIHDAWAPVALPGLVRARQVSACWRVQFPVPANFAIATPPNRAKLAGLFDERSPLWPRILPPAPNLL